MKMGRPKGSKNKKSEKKSPEDTQPAPETKSTKPVGHGVTVVEEAWTPKPDMGKIKPPADQEATCECLHKKAMHYGPEKDWCNTGGCQCQSFNKK
jgi:hypothetical protein